MKHTDVDRLNWPAWIPRTKEPKRANFSRQRTSYYSSYDGQRHARKSNKPVTVAEGISDLMDELRKLGADDNVIVSTNLRTRQDGLPHSNAAEPNDSGVAVYFAVGEEDMVMACDRWDRVADNLRAIAKTIDALRGIDRWGSAEMIRATFTGFKALPQSGTGTPWWTTLGIDRHATETEMRRAFRAQAKIKHPDVGGNASEWMALQEALDQALAQAPASRDQP